MYKVLLIFAVVRLSATRSLFDIPTINEFVNNVGSRVYNFGFKTSDGTTRREMGELIHEGTPEEDFVVTGETTWFTPEGVQYGVTYVADKFGYRPTVMQMEATQINTVQPDIETDLPLSRTEQVPPPQTRIGSGTAAALIGKK